MEMDLLRCEILGSFQERTDTTYPVMRSTSHIVVTRRNFTEMAEMSSHRAFNWRQGVLLRNSITGNVESAPVGKTVIMQRRCRQIGLGARGLGRKIISSEDGHELRESQISYSGHLGSEKRPRRYESRLPWRIYDLNTI
jgi:hypothetical protein